MRFLGRYTEPFFALLRIVAGLLFAMHGAQKMFGLWGVPPMTHVPLLLTAAIIELVGGILVLAGFFTEVVAFVCSGEMAVAYFKGHFMNGGFWPIQNHGEPAVLFCFLFLFIAAHGAGRWSVDAALRGRRRT